MKNFNSPLSPLLLTFLMLGLGIALLAGLLSGCSFSTKHAVPVHQKLQWDEVSQFKDNYTYKIKFRDKRKSLKVLGKQLNKEGSHLTVQSNGTSEQIPIQSIKKIRGIGTERIGSQIAKGAGYGAAGGFVLGFIPAFAANGDCRTADDKGDCQGLVDVGRAIIVAGSTAGGALVGTLIGAFIPKKPKITITPTFNKKQNNTHVGLGLATPF